MGLNWGSKCKKYLDINMLYIYNHAKITRNVLE